MQQAACLILENGAVFEGIAFGAWKETIGEVVFTTGMTGYLETLTDPSYYGQIVVQTFPLIGNYGIIPADFESNAPRCRGYIVGEWCQAPSNFRQEGTLDTFLKGWGIPGLWGIDTRALTKMIREKGVMNGKITASAESAALHSVQAAAYRVADAVPNAGIQTVSTHKPQGEERFHVVLWDFGAKEGILRELLARGCRVTRVPWNTTAQAILELHPDGVMLSNGPGDPTDNLSVIWELAQVCKAGIPIFGICLGHQLLALAQGGKTEKLHYGHRGTNQPVKALETGRLYITSQNHGYAVVGDSLPSTARVSMINANDGSCEGIDYQDMPAFSVQFHPEGCGGPQDTRFLFDRFVENMQTLR
ncbi:carbamoyl phosphate synthase small subunit [Oscillospiraceae bacterium MB08-C2-2]|nr:carbamoyl phosphate synthase small subunit [Oscillospiraceae bacterium MB08-C2-2]